MGHNAGGLKGAGLCIDTRPNKMARSERGSSFIAALGHGEI